MTAEAFSACLRETLKWEGGWFNHPRDPGGPTMRGVIQRVYDGYRRRKGRPLRTVRLIDEAELQEIYRRSYWDLVRGDELPPGIDLAVFDFGVNSGPARAVRYAQRVAGVAQDGQMGEATLDALRAADPVAFVRAYQAARLGFVRRISTFDVFGKGWTNRIRAIEKAAVRRALAGDNKELAPVVAPDLSPDLPDVEFEPVARATPDRPTTTPGDIGTGIAVGTGTVAVVKEGIEAAERAGDLVSTLAGIVSSPGFWLALAVVGGTLYAWKRFRPQIEEAFA